MKAEFDKKKSAEFLAGVVHSTVDMGKKAALTAKSGVAAMMEKSKSDSYERRLKKYNPLFPEQYSSASFNLPNMIVIVDDAVRRGIDVCEGAIGWLDSSSGVEILYLYDEAVVFSGLQFVPSASCDSIYYVDSFDRTRFIRTEYLFSKAHEERLAELKHIAFMLGAKKCTIEISESGSEAHSAKASVKANTNAKGSHAGIDSDRQSSTTDNRRISGHVEAEFQGCETPRRPQLKWFAHDDNINRLIDMRCSCSNALRRETLELQGATSATMSEKTANTIDGAITKIGGGKMHASMNAQATREHQSSLLYIVEF